MIREMLKMAAKSRNLVDDLASVMVESMRYCDSSVDYPDFKKLKPDDGVVAEWLYPIINGDNDFSELSAILMYTQQEAKFEDIGELVLGIALTEMKHYGKLNDFIKKLGGHIGKRYTSEYVQLGKTVLEALRIAADGEQKTIDFYESILDKLCNTEAASTTMDITAQFMNKLIADEKVHLQLLNDKISEYETNG